jgi:hypothetical protein
MARISIRVFVDDVEVDRVEEDLPAEAVSSIVDSCRQAVAERRPLSPEEEAEEAAAWAHFREQTRLRRPR